MFEPCRVAFYWHPGQASASGQVRVEQWRAFREWRRFLCARPQFAKGGLASKSERLPQKQARRAVMRVWKIRFLGFAVGEAGGARGQQRVELARSSIEVM